MVQGKPQRPSRLLEKSLLLGETGLCVLLRPSVDWLRPCHRREGSLLSQDHWLYRASHSKAPLWKHPRAHPAKVTH